MNKIIASIATATDSNAHWTAAEIIAREWGSEAESNLLSFYALAHKERGFILDHESQARSAITTAILSRLPTATASAIGAAL
jgi:hypothetical protein